MAIKKLQNDFTTPEQSKRLLELGVPADSANYVYVYYEDENSLRMILQQDITYAVYSESVKLLPNRKTAPCWSAGRLMEIYGICMGVEGFFYCKGNFIDEAIRRIEGSVKNTFSYV